MNNEDNEGNEECLSFLLLIPSITITVMIVFNS